jgi:sec-independent protein translocase protein TatB
MFNIGFSELVILAVIGLIVIGPEQLPDLARKLAKILNDLKRARDEIMSPVTEFKNKAEKMVEDARRDADRKIHEQVVEIMNALPKEEDITGQKTENPAHQTTSSTTTPEKKENGQT